MAEHPNESTEAVFTATGENKSNRNEAAQRLRALIADRFDPISAETNLLLGEALGAERRATVERIREEVYRIAAVRDVLGTPRFVVPEIEAILDGELR